MLGSYPEHICDGLSSLVAKFVDSKVDACNAGVVLSKIERKSMVSGGLTGVNMFGQVTRQVQNKFSKESAC